MFALLIAAGAAAFVAGGAPGRDARIVNQSELGDAKMLVNALPLKFPEGTATMALGVSAKGRLMSCAMTSWESGGRIDPAIEKLICDTIRMKAKFDPALNSDGQPVNSIYQVGIDPILPEEPYLPTIAGLFSPDDYPNAALRAGIQGNVTVGVEVSADGKPTACKVIESSGNAALDSKTCEVFMQRAKFTPGKSADGRPLGGHDITTVRWQLPDHQRLADMALRTSITFDADGKTISCESYWGETGAQDQACAELQSIASEYLTPVQRAFRTLTREEGLLIGPRQAADRVGKHEGEERLAMLATFLTVNEHGQVVGCEAVDPKEKDVVVPVCASAKRTKFSFGEEPVKGVQTAVSYRALILRRPGF